jgi:hypothetical protein
MEEIMEDNRQRLRQVQNLEDLVAFRIKTLEKPGLPVLPDLEPKNPTNRVVLTQTDLPTLEQIKSN